MIVSRKLRYSVAVHGLQAVLYGTAYDIQQL